jgi:hypothetical protein
MDSKQIGHSVTSNKTGGVEEDAEMEDVEDEEMEGAEDEEMEDAEDEEMEGAEDDDAGYAEWASLSEDDRFVASPFGTFFSFAIFFRLGDKHRSTAPLFSLSISAWLLGLLESESPLTTMASPALVPVLVLDRLPTEEDEAEDLSDDGSALTSSLTLFIGAFFFFDSSL